ncbi:hypothetical protein AS29_000300 [Bacillus sp. SJS]|nr:hypothetical protein AS29_000300 [Bacillus sp. SJS]
MMIILESCFRKFCCFVRLISAPASLNRIHLKKLFKTAVFYKSYETWLLISSAGVCLLRRGH